MKNVISFCIAMIFICSISFAQYHKSSLRTTDPGELLVNDDTTGIGIGSFRSQVTYLPNGNYVVVWEEGVNSKEGPKSYKWSLIGGLYFQIFRGNGEPLTPITPVVESTVMHYNLQHMMGQDEGTSVFGIKVHRNGDFTIFRDFYSDGGNLKVYTFTSEGKKVGREIYLEFQADGNYWGPWLFDFEIIENDTILFAWDSELIVHFQPYTHYWSKLYGRLFSIGGDRLGELFPIGDSDSNTTRYSPPRLTRASDTAYAVWADTRTGRWDIYIQKFTPSGDKYGKNIRVNDDTSSVNRSEPYIGSDRFGRVLVLWKDERNTHPDIYGQWLSPLGTAVGTNFQVNDPSVHSGAPRVTFDSHGNADVYWIIDKELPHKLYIQRYSVGRSRIGSNERIDVDTTQTRELNISSVALDGSGNTLITWRLCRLPSFDFADGIQMQRYDSTRQKSGNSIRINSTKGTSMQSEPAIASNSNGDRIVVWKDKRRDSTDWFRDDNRQFPADLFIQSYNSSLAKGGVNHIVNSDSTRGEIHTPGWWKKDLVKPSIVMNSNGDYCVVWRAGDNIIYAEWFSSVGIKQGPTVTVSDSVLYAGTVSSAIDGTGRIAVVWCGRRDDLYSSTDKSYAQLFDASGNKVGSNWSITEDTASTSQTYPSIAMGDAGDFVVVWQEMRSGRSIISAQRYDAEWKTSGSRWQVNQDSTEVTRPFVKMDGSGNVLIIWQERDVFNYQFDAEIFFRRYDNAGNALGDAFNTQIPGEEYSVAMDSTGRFAIVWGVDDYEDGGKVIFKTLKGQIFDRNGTVIGGNFVIATDVTDPCITATTQNITVAYSATRRHLTPDVFIKTFDWNWGGMNAVNEKEISIPTGFSLSQNYPNPFNPSTTIRYALPSSAKVKLSIYDLLGREIATLVNEEQSAGWKEVEWNATNVSSGIYFYKLQTESFVDVKKMIVVK